MPEPSAPKSDKEILSAAVQFALRVAAAVLVTALVEIILVAAFLMSQVSLGERYDPVRSFFPVLSALAGVPVLAVLKGKPLFFAALAFALVMTAAMWYFQSALFILWGTLSATG
jgi:hypothetical protein